MEMRSLRSYFALVALAVGAVVSLPDCVIKATTTDCTAGDTATCSCGDGKTGKRVCDSSGSFGPCSCEAVFTTVATTGSATVTVGVTVTSTTGAGGGTTGSTGAGGNAGTGYGGSGGWADSGVKDAAGDSGPGIDACDDCMLMKCAQEFQDCLDDPICFSPDGDGSGQYEKVVNCVEQKRTIMSVKRPDLRSCGLTVGTGSGWPPDGMADTTTNIMNCMATGQTMVPMNNSWADPMNLTQPWAANSCAKIACTSMVQ
jgi:hypothetical protein